MSKRDADILLEDMLLAIKKIERYVAGQSLSEFVKDDKTVDAVTRNIQVIGEAVVRLPDELKLKYPKVKWHQIKGMRNRLVHEYFGVDAHILREIIQDNIPQLKKDTESILAELSKK